MSTLSPEEIARHAYDAGFRGHGLTTAVAVALAESGGRTRAHNDTPPDDSYGLWQINMIGALGRERRDQLDLDADRDLFDPAANARAAFAISEGGESFRPWTTFTTGRHERYLDQARRAARAVRRENRGGGGEGDRDGFLVDPDALTDYARRAGAIADELTALRRNQLRGMRGLAEDSFGRIGAETGFAAALDRFGHALSHQLRGVARSADTVAGSVTRTARHYREQESDIADELLGLLRDK
ncbi:transglycosylase SLT domain-containing protein [Actinophytocola xanthii]|uniref:Lytic transglycosylase n=1 Tax=Actinophytocola xanthii TaxID=1912961 RepID=A0A1Q8CSZ7_9PSEU|nr:type VII secretion target [Actinophytocola xanthii]OLF17481.1 lytic transglycosylase [Actinophytocola xanthii]